MLDKRNQRYYDYLLRLQRQKFTGTVQFNFHEGTIGSAHKESKPMVGVKENERVELR